MNCPVPQVNQPADDEAALGDEDAKPVQSIWIGHRAITGNARIVEAMNVVDVHKPAVLSTLAPPHPLEPFVALHDRHLQRAFAIEVERADVQ